MNTAPAVKVATARPWAENRPRCPATRTWDAPGESAVWVDRCALPAGHAGDHMAVVDAAAAKLEP